MTLFDIIWIYIIGTFYPVCNEVDRFLKVIMEENAVPYRTDDDYLIVYLDGESFSLRWEPYDSCNLSWCSKDHNYVYNRLCPSRRMICKFMKWVGSFDKDLLLTSSRYREVITRQERLGVLGDILEKYEKKAV